MEPICRADTENGLVVDRKEVGKRWGRNRDSNPGIYTLHEAKQTASRKLLCNTGTSLWASYDNPRGVGMGREGGWRGEDTYLYLWPIHIVWQRSIQHLSNYPPIFKKAHVLRYSNFLNISSHHKPQLLLLFVNRFKMLNNRGYLLLSFCAILMFQLFKKRLKKIRSLHMSWGYTKCINVSSCKSKKLLLKTMH